MAQIIVLPKMNLTMDDGILTKWYIKEGDNISKGDLVCSVENEKEAGDVESLYDGIVLKLLAQEDEKYDVSTPIAVIGEAQENWQSALDQLAEMQALESKSKIETRQSEQKETVHTRPIIMPKIKNLLKEKGISIDEITSHFGNIKISEKEVEIFEKLNFSSVALGPNDRVISLSPMMKSVAKNMKISCEKTARLTNFIEVDMTDILNVLAKEKTAGKKISATAVIIKSCVSALAEFPECNAVFDEKSEKLIYRGDYNIGFAVDIPDGLVVAVVKNADEKSVEEISFEIYELSKKARETGLSSQDMSAGTFTVSNIGMLDCDFFTPIINYPQTAILAIGTIKTLPRYLNNEYSTVYPRKIMTIGITYDHRVVNGAPAARFLLAVRNALQENIGIF